MLQKLGYSNIKKEKKKKLFRLGYKTIIDSNLLGNCVVSNLKLLLLQLLQTQDVTKISFYNNIKENYFI